MVVSFFLHPVQITSRVTSFSYKTECLAQYTDHPLILAGSILLFVDLVFLMPLVFVRPI
jgi:hypothetical protein